MPKLTVPENKVISSQGAERSGRSTAASTASGAKLGSAMSDAASSVAESGKLGRIQSSQAAGSVAQVGDYTGGIIQKEAAGAADYAQLGQSQMEVGSMVMRQGNDMLNKAMTEMTNYIEKSRAAVEDGLYNNTYSEAVKEFSQRSMDRMNQPYDQNGSPTFMSLSSDIGGLASEIKTKYGAQLQHNPETFNKFDQSFTTMSTNQQINAMKEARGQQIEYSKGSLENFLNTNSVAALSGDRSALPAYVAQSNERIDSAYKNGFISYEQAVKLKDKNRHDVNYGYLENLAQKEPNTVFADLGMDPNIKAKTNDELGITPVERAKLIDVTAKRVKAQQHADQVRVAQEKAIVKEQQTFHADNLDLGISQEKVSEADIDAYFNDGKISHKQMVNLKQKVIAENKKGLSKAQTREEISTHINNGDLLSSKFSGAAINDHYSEQIKTSGAQELFNANLPNDRARLAAQYRAPVTNFTNELDGIAKGGTPEQIMQAMNAYRYVSQKSPLAVSKMNPKTEAFYATLDSQTRFSNVEPATAIENAKKLVFDATDEQLKARRSDWNDKGSPFSKENISGTITGMYDLGHNVFTNDKIDGFAQQQITKQLRDAYVLTGDANAAKAMVMSQTQGVFGTSGLNEQSQLTRNNSVFMYAPPEKVYGPGTPTNFSVEDMRANLNFDVTPYLTKSDMVDQSGVKPDQILVGSGEFTNRSSGAVYSLYYIDQYGQDQPLINPNTGQPVYWKPDGGFISEHRSQKDYVRDEAQYQKQQRVSNQFGLPAGQSKTGETSSQNRVPFGNQKHVIDTALSFIGVHEVKDKDSLGKVMGRMLGQSIDPSQTPWCAAFVNTVLKANGLEGTGSFAARSFLKYGQPTTTPVKGDIVVLSRGSDVSKGHVGFFMGYDEQGNVMVLGGNQSDSVNVKSFDADKVLSFRSVDGNQQSGVSTISAPTSDVAGYRTLPSSEEARELFSTGDFKQVPNKPLTTGIRQNNPGHIIKTGSRWSGEVPNASSRFKEFASPEDGIAAIVNNLKSNYMAKGFNTLEKIVKRWTATKEHWPAYIQNLSNATGLKSGEKFDLNKMQPQQIVNLIRAMIVQENGYSPYPDSVIMDGIVRGQ